MQVDRVTKKKHKETLRHPLCAEWVLGFFSSLVFLLVFFPYKRQFQKDTPKYETVQASLQNHKEKMISIHVSHLKSYISTQKSMETSEKMEICKSAGSFSTGAETWDVMETEGLLLCWGHASALSSKANPGCILIETGCPCPDMFCVCLPLFITLTTSSGLRQLNSITATDARSYSQWFTIGLYFVPPGCTPLPTMLPLRKGPCHVVNSV